MPPTTRRALLASALLFTTSLAQVSNSSASCSDIDNPEQCCPNFLSLPYVTSSNTSVVSTGSVSFSPIANQDDWILSVLVNDTGRRTGNGPDRYTRKSFLGVSNSAPSTSVCLYQFSPLNATKLSDGSGCAGVFSDECAAYIQQAVFNATNADWRPGEECKDPLFMNSRVERGLIERCGMRLTPNEQTYSRERFIVPNNNCSYPALPGIELPDNYHTPAHGSSYWLYDDTGTRSGYSDIRSASTYDQFLSQVVPFAVVTSQTEGNQNNAVELVCVTPNHTRPGAPAISDATPWDETSGGGSGGGTGESGAVSRAMSSSIVVMVAGLVGLTFAI